MSRALPSWPVQPAPEQARAKPLRRLHSEPDPAFEGLDPFEIHKCKLDAKKRMFRLVAELASLRGKLSNYDLAEIWLGSRNKEGTIRSWKNLCDIERAPREEDLDELQHIVNRERDLRFGGSLR